MTDGATDGVTDGATDWATRATRGCRVPMVTARFRLTIFRTDERTGGAAPYTGRHPEMSP